MTLATSGVPAGSVPDASRLMLEVEVAPAVQLSRLRHAFVIPGARRQGLP